VPGANANVEGKLIRGVNNLRKGDFRRQSEPYRNLQREKKAGKESNALNGE